MKNCCLQHPALLAFAGMLAPLLLSFTALSLAATCAADDQGVQILTRGPIHEAFAAASMSGSMAGVVIARAPYDPITEMPPEQRPEGDDVTWIPGYWSWDDDRNDFIWVSGVWRDLPPGRQWVPGYWATASGGSQWISGFWGDMDQAEFMYLPSPPEPLEAGPSSPQPGPGTSWAPGCWIWQQTGYAWQPGYWVSPQPQWVWSPAHYTWTPRGYLYVPGYWDHDLGHRGVIFAPVYYEQPVYARPNYYYSPVTIIDLAVVVNFMFIQPRSRHYYFGDYYDRRYEDRGYYPWHSRQAARYGDDPLYIQYRAEQLRHDRDWDIHVEDLYRQRRDHAEYRPPQTLAIQINLLKESRSDGRENVVIGRDLRQAVESRNPSQRFATVDADERSRFENRGREVRKLQSERATLENSNPTADTQVREAPDAAPARVRMPRSPVTARSVESGGRSKTPPPAPAVPAARTAARDAPTGRTPIEVSNPARKAPVQLDAPETRAPRRDSNGIPTGTDATPRTSPAVTPRSIEVPRPRVNRPQIDTRSTTRGSSKSRTVAPRRDQGSPPSGSVKSTNEREALKAKRPKSSEARKQVKPKRGVGGVSTNLNTNPGR